jgi:hypothetical protein
VEQRENAGSRGPHRSVISAGRVTLGGRPFCVGAAETAKEGPLVELVREDGVIRAIDITCACGQRVRLLCTYD